MKPKLIYIMGTARSGSTILEILLARMPQTLAAGELTHIVHDGFIDNAECSCRARFRQCPLWSRVLARLDLKQEQWQRWHRLNRKLDWHSGLFRQILGLFPFSALAAYQFYNRRLLMALARASGCSTIIDSSKYAGRALALMQDQDMHIICLTRSPEGLYHAFQKPNRNEQKPKSLGALGLYYGLVLLQLKIVIHRSRAPVSWVTYEALCADPDAVLRQLGHRLHWPLRRLHRHQWLPVGHILTGNRLRYQRRLRFKPEMLPPRSYTRKERIVLFLMRQWAKVLGFTVDDPAVAELCKPAMNLKTLDPYDIWATPVGVQTRRRYYEKRLSGRLAAVGLGLLDWLLPLQWRRYAGTEPAHYPIVLSHQVMRRFKENALPPEAAKRYLAQIDALAIKPAPDDCAWGLGFAWMSKNGLYDKQTPFITHTPYVMEALLILAACLPDKRPALDLFHKTWAFLQRLVVCQESAIELALSYAPRQEPRIVVNANAYAALAYALHARHGRPERQPMARQRAIKLLRWCLNQQQADGSWLYYADHQPGNFIDCFHSCFVVKNLRKAAALLSDPALPVDQAIRQGQGFIEQHFPDPQSGLCRRFIQRDIRDPYRWDLYDQAEYLGLLIDAGRIDTARHFAHRVEERFRKNGVWYVRIDCLGRLWGKNFLRWGVLPFLYQKSRLNN